MARDRATEGSLGGRDDDGEAVIVVDPTRDTRLTVPLSSDVSSSVVSVESTVTLMPPAADRHWSNIKRTAQRTSTSAVTAVSETATTAAAVAVGGVRPSEAEGGFMRLGVHISDATGIAASWKCTMKCCEGTVNGPETAICLVCGCRRPPNPEYSTVADGLINKRRSTKRTKDGVPKEVRNPWPP